MLLNDRTIEPYCSWKEGISNRSMKSAFQNNINGFYSKAQILEQNLHYKQPISKKDIDYNFQYLYVHHWSETGRFGVLCRRDLHSTLAVFALPEMRLSSRFISIKWLTIEYPIWMSLSFNILMISSVLDTITLTIVVGTLELHIINTLPFDCTFMKGNATSSIDITLCSSSILPLISNWRTDDVELYVHSDHLPITFNIKTTWSSSQIERQKIETWNLRSNKWEQFRLRLKRNVDNWMQSNETNSVARYLLAKIFAEPPQPPKDVDENHYEIWRYLNHWIKVVFGHLIFIKVIL
ncbi:hypothetical protein RFI_39586 [Reticulomyxa filosa]|uniref:Endonuclease/exonuclease/phosphatase domain-containing protein n=1 Tax=Reticulomyxa filosa TaxID=46433 RepID=X6L9Z4_RETFI|nr:hypothetical protein RFI_39586 [Reticulomyxa filosa]|eukprot:ETN97936.1 hypothetical protein RFI_39586 [Reticulomyxa filosa]